MREGTTVFEDCDWLLQLRITRWYAAYALIRRRKRVVEISEDGGLSEADSWLWLAGISSFSSRVH